jgi:hypothetical protein
LRPEKAAGTPEIWVIFVEISGVVAELAGDLPGISVICFVHSGPFVWLPALP